MKKSILVMLMAVMVATPCFAQEIETDGLFSIMGTTWRYIGLAFLNEAPFIMPIDHTIYFTDLEISGRYRDFLVFSVASESFYISYPYRGYGLGILQPTIGIGMFELLMLKEIYTARSLVGVGFGYMVKIDNDDWTPPGVV